MLCSHGVYFLFVFTYHVIKRNFQENQPALHCVYRHQSRFIAVNTRQQNSAKDISALLTFSDRFLASKFQMHSCVIDTARIVCAAGSVKLSVVCPFVCWKGPEFKVEEIQLTSNFQRPKWLNCVGSENIFKVQEYARGSLLPCQSLVGLRLCTQPGRVQQCWVSSLLYTRAWVDTEINRLESHTNFTKQKLSKKYFWKQCFESLQGT